MKFFSVAFALSLVFFALAAPSPASTELEVSKRQLGGLTNILGLLGGAQSALGPVLGILNGVTGGSGASPLAALTNVTQIISGLTSSLSGLPAVVLDGTTGGAENQVADVVGNIVVQIGTAVNGLPSTLLTVVAVINIDIALQALLLQVSGLITGILVLITPVVAILTTLTGGLGLTSVLGLLGLL